MPSRKRNSRRNTIKKSCTNKQDLVTLEDLPSKNSDIVNVNENKPYHCMTISSFLDLWEYEAGEGRNVRNPMTNIVIPKKHLDILFKKIKAKIPDAKHPQVKESRVQHGWDDQGYQTRQVIAAEDELTFDEAANAIAAEREERIAAVLGLYDELLEFKDKTDVESVENFEKIFKKIWNYPEQYGERYLVHPWVIRFLKDLLIPHLQNGSPRVVRKYQKILTRLEETLVEEATAERRRTRTRSRGSRRHRRGNQDGGSKRKRKSVKKSKKKSKRKSKKKVIRKHKGINQKTGRLNKGYKYSSKKLKSGLKKIVKVLK